MSMKEDLANRSPDIHWPEGFTPADADLFAHNEISINAPLGVTCGHFGQKLGSHHRMAAGKSYDR